MHHVSILCIIYFNPFHFTYKLINSILFPPIYFSSVYSKIKTPPFSSVFTHAVHSFLAFGSPSSTNGSSFSPEMANGLLQNRFYSDSIPLNRPFQPAIKKKRARTAREKLLSSDLWVARIESLWKEVDGTYWFRAQWYIISEETSIASFEHVMSMILMVSEKFRENVAAWICFYDRKDIFKTFLDRVLRLKEAVLHYANANWHQV